MKNPLNSRVEDTTAFLHPAESQIVVNELNEACSGANTRELLKHGFGLEKPESVGPQMYLPPAEIKRLVRVCPGRPESGPNCNSTMHRRNNNVTIVEPSTFLSRSRSRSSLHTTEMQVGTLSESCQNVHRTE